MSLVIADDTANAWLTKRSHGPKGSLLSSLAPAQPVRSSEEGVQ